MSVLFEIRALLENIDYSAWRMPTKKELENEYISEYFFANLTLIHDQSNSTRIKFEEKYKNLLIDNIMKFSKIETINLKQGMDIYWTDKLDELKKVAISRHKSPDTMIQSYESGEQLPYPIFIRKIDGKFDILGGRTRVSIARILGVKPIKGIVIDEKKLKKFFQPYWIKDIIDNDLFIGVASFLDNYKVDKTSPDFLPEFKKYVTGKINKFPDMPELEKAGNLFKIQVPDDAEYIRKKIGIG